MLKHLKMLVSNWLLRHVLNLITEKGAIEIRVTDIRKKIGHVYIDGRKVTSEEQSVLIEDTKMALKLHGLQTVISSIRAEATYNLINKSKGIDDMVYAKAMLYTVDVLQKRLTALSNLSQP